MAATWWHHRHHDSLPVWSHGSCCGTMLERHSSSAISLPWMFNLLGPRFFRGKTRRRIEFSGYLKQQIGSPGETTPERYLSIGWRHESRWAIRSGSEIIPPSVRQPKDSLTEVSGPVARLRSQSSFTFDALFINTALPRHSLGKKKSWVSGFPW